MGWKQTKMSRGALPASAFEPQPFQKASRALGREKEEPHSQCLRARRQILGAMGDHSSSKFNPRENISKWNYAARTPTRMSRGPSPRDVLMTIPVPGIKEYDISFRSGAINDVFWKENLEEKKMRTTSCVVMPRSGPRRKINRGLETKWLPKRPCALIRWLNKRLGRSFHHSTNACPQHRSDLTFDTLGLKTQLFHLPGL